MGDWKDLWKDVDRFAAKSKQQWTFANEEISKLPGWKFKGCPDGLIWSASHRSLREDIKARSAEDLVKKVKAERERAENEAKRKSQGVR